MKVSIRTYFADDRGLANLDQLRQSENPTTAPPSTTPRRSACGRGAPRAASCLIRSSMSIVCSFSTMPSILTVHGRSFSACAARAMRLGRAELEEIVVVDVDLLVGHGPVEHVFLVALDRIEARGRVRQVGNALRHGEAPATATARRRRYRPASARRLRKMCSGVASRSGISQPRRRITCMGRPSGFVA